MRRTLTPVDVGSMPTDPTEKQVSGFRNQVSGVRLQGTKQSVKNTTCLVCEGGSFFGGLRFEKAKAFGKR